MGEERSKEAAEFVHVLENRAKSPGLLWQHLKRSGDVMFPWQHD